MRRFLATLLLVLVSCSRGGDLAPDASPGDLPDLAGTYVVNGVDPLGTEYGGSLTISEGDGLHRYVLLWIVTGSIQEGTGRVEGNRLLADWWTVEGIDARARGTAVFTVTEAGELYGTRRLEGSDGVGTEEAFPND